MLQLKEKTMLRIFGMMVVVMLAVACEQETFPPQCVEEVFDEEKYKDADYPIVRDAIQQISQNDYNCFANTALEMLKMPEKQALYTPAVQGYNHILWDLNGYNKYLKGEHEDRTANIIYIPSRLRIQMQIDDFLRGKLTAPDPTKIPEACRQYPTSAERNRCYDKLLAEYTEKYILDEYIPRYGKHKSYKKQYAETVNNGTSAIRALYEAVSDNQDRVEQQLEAYYLELFHAYFEILSLYQ